MRIITYKSDACITALQLKELYAHSNTDARRPIQDLTRLQAILDHSDFFFTAWDDDKLVGICRCLSDVGYVIYIVDMAVHTDYQGQGIGKALINMVKEKADGILRIILMSTKEANSFYEKMAFESHPRAWIIPGDIF